MVSKTKTNPLVNAFMRLTGEWPLSGPPPLSEGQYKKLFDSNPAFVDYFPIVDYDEETQCYLMEDLVNVVKVYRVSTKNMTAKSDDFVDNFNTQVTQALNALPTDNDKSPYIVQVYMSVLPNTSTHTDLTNSIDPELLSDPFTQEVLRVVKTHDELITHEAGIFDDKRIESSNPKGWRVSDTAVYLCVYRKPNPGEWKKNKNSPAKQIEKDLASFRTAMGAAGLAIDNVKPAALINWLAPLFGHTTQYSDEEIDELKSLANFDIGQRIFSTQPKYHCSDDKKERGIYQFGDTWSRYLTIGGVEAVPSSGQITLGEQSVEGSSAKLGASVFEKLPVGSMMSYTIIPQSDFAMKGEINQILYLSHDGSSREAQYATEQAEEVHNEMLRNRQKVFYVQMGVYLSANGLEELLDKTEQTIAEIKNTKCIEVVKPSLDLISQDAYVRALPCVYDWGHDRKSSLRARKAYTSHLASLLPFFGNRGGSNNPCYIMYSRSGEPFYINPIKDKTKVAHEVFFGPSGSGKSASVCGMTMMSMAVNNPRMFIFDYGNSFKLLGDFAEKWGKKVKRIKLSANSEDVLAPFYETQKALEEAEIAKQINDGTYVGVVEKEEDEEDRSYLAEMEYVLKIMITGGNKRADDALTLSDISRIQTALVRGLQISQEAGEAHARPTHMREAMLLMSEEEAGKKGGIQEIAHKLRDMADAIQPWTKGLRGMLFNRTAKGFDEDNDLTIIEIGNLGKAGSQDMLAVAGLSAIYTITALAEKLENSGRPIQIRIDEAHLWAKVPALLQGLLVAAKVFRKLNTWLCVITQDISDFKGESSKIITNSEFLWLMKMSATETNELGTVIDLDDEIKYLIKFPQIEKQCYVEGISICDKYDDALIRYVPPSLILAIAQTDGNEKEYRHKVMKEHNCTELEAAYIIGEEIETARRQYQLNKENTA